MSCHAEIPVLESQRLQLRGHRQEDFANCAAMWADPKVVAHIHGVPSTEEQTWSRLLRYGGHWQFLGFGYWVVEDKDTGAFIGEVGFADYKRQTTPSLEGRPEAGWVLCSSAHGKGFATEAVAAMLSWADAHLEATHTVCIFDPDHKASIHVAGKVGFSNPVLGQYAGNPTLFMERARA